MTEETRVVKYEARDGQQVTLSFETIKKYLVQGHSEYVTKQEMMYFMGICKSRGLNPFVKDCYLIKYSQNEGAAIITSIDYFRKRAKAQRDCKGWKKGIIVERNGEIIYSNGLMLEGDTLLGGWFTGQPEGWTEPLPLEINLKGYIKRTRDGRITKFWAEENQPSQIMKVAESQGLRTLWPDEFQQLYTPEEIGEVDTFKQAEVIVDEAKDTTEDLTAAIKGDVPETPAQVSQDAPGEEKTPGPSVPDPDADPFRAEWINLRGPGFATYFYKNKERFRGKYEAEGREKWKKLYSEPWPLDPPAELTKELSAAELISQGIHTRHEEEKKEGNGPMLWCEDRKMHIFTKICRQACKDRDRCQSWQEWQHEHEEAAG